MAIITDIKAPEAADQTNDEDQIKVNNANQTELKNATDDHIKKYLTKSLRFAESHRHTDVKLALGYISCVLAAVASYYGYVNSFEDSKLLTLICVAAYFILNTASTLYGMIIEKETLFVGDNPITSESVRIDTNLKRHSTDYTITFYRVKSGSKDADKKPADFKLKGSFEAWFDEDGVLVEEALEKDLRQGLEAVGIRAEKQHTQ